MTEETINTLCEKFNTTVDNLIPAYSKYAMNKDLMNIGIVAIIILIGFITINIIRKKNKTMKENTPNNFNEWLYDDSFELTHSLLIIIICIVIFVCFINILYNIYDYVLWTTSPSMRFFETIINKYHP